MVIVSYEAVFQFVGEPWVVLVYLMALQEGCCRSTR